MGFCPECGNYHQDSGSLCINCRAVFNDPNRYWHRRGVPNPNKGW